MIKILKMKKIEYEIWDTYNFKLIDVYVLFMYIKILRRIIVMYFNIWWREILRRIIVIYFNIWWHEILRRIIVMHFDLLTWLRELF
jgi:hypothetical protein